MSRDFDREEEYEEDRPVPAVTRSGAVTAVAIVNFILGALYAVIGVVVIVAGPAFLGAAFKQAEAQGQLTEEQKAQVAQAGGMMGAIAGVIGVCLLIIALPLLLAGYGVLQRRGWGRILTIVIGIILGIFGVLSLLGANIIGAVIDLGYCVFVLVVLFNSKFAKEFA
jgi:hypothetical protein